MDNTSPDEQDTSLTEVVAKAIAEAEKAFYNYVFDQQLDFPCRIRINVEVDDVEGQPYKRFEYEEL